MLKKRRFIILFLKKSFFKKYFNPIVAPTGLLCNKHFGKWGAMMTRYNARTTNPSKFLEPNVISTQIASCYSKVKWIFVVLAFIFEERFFFWRYAQKLCCSVRPKFGFGVGNRNQGSISVSVSEPKFLFRNQNFFFKFFQIFSCFSAC